MHQFLLLDEPTSALDSKSEATFQEALNGLMKGRTVLMIAHRLTTVKQADLICVLAGGKMVEMGTYDELLQKGGLFSELHSTQFSASKNQINSPSNDQETVSNKEQIPAE